MAIADHRHHHHKSQSDTKLFRLCPFWQSGNTSSSSSSTQNLTHSNIGNLSGRHVEGPSNPKPPPKTVSSVARSLLPPRRRLRLDPSSNLYFPSTSSFYSTLLDFFFVLSILTFFRKKKKKKSFTSKIGFWIFLVFKVVNLDEFLVVWLCLVLYFCEDEPGKQVKSAIRLKNTSRSHVAFKVLVSFLFWLIYFLMLFRVIHYIGLDSL